MNSDAGISISTGTGSGSEHISLTSISRNSHLTMANRLKRN